MQIKTAMWYDFTLIILAIVKQNKTKNKCCQERGGRNACYICKILCYIYFIIIKKFFKIYFNRKQIKDRSITYCIRYCVKCLHILSHLILTMTLSGRCNSYPHFPEEATEAQAGGVTCLGTQLRVFTVSGTPSSQNKESPRAEQGSGAPLAASLQHFLIVRHCVPEPQPPGPLSWEEGLLCGWDEVSPALLGGCVAVHSNEGVLPRVVVFPPLPRPPTSDKVFS